ncbi:methyltransferase [Microdochium bolleyi]|uniref:Methyltransferase n=1 Tax=Microdochium bolleyi TaxID=196109 RepID=A0A136J3W8_9PEZI|nr:methyltransferase [Microdochium bolleyi]
MSAPSDDSTGNALPDNIKARLKASYDIIAPAYNSWTIPNSGQRLQYLDKLTALVPQLNGHGDSRDTTTTTTSTASSTGAKILELGCGCGVPVTQKLLAYPNSHVLANDMSSTQIKLAKEALLVDNALQDRIEFLEGDMAGLSIEPGSLDAVLGLYSIFHLPRAEQPAMLGRIADWLKPGGYFLGNFAGEEAEAVVFDKWLHDDGWMFYSGLGAEGTLGMVRDAGFEVIVGEVKEDVVKAEFLWVIARKL